MPGARLGRVMGLEVADMARLARSLWEIAADEAEDAQVAIAWVVRNLIAGRGKSVEESCECLRSLRPDQAGDRTRECGFSDRGYCRTFSILCRVWAGDIDDPTSGATTAHRHDEAPAWAEDIAATALIGPWLFYRRD